MQNSKMKMRCFLFVILTTILLPEYVSAYQLTFVYDYFNYSDVETTDFVDYIDIRDNYIYNYREENCSVNFYSLVSDIDSTYSYGRPSLFNACVSQVLVSDVMDTNGNSYNSSVLHILYNETIAWKALVNVWANATPTDNYFNVEGIFRTNITDLDMTQYYHDRKYQYVFDMTDFCGSGLDVRNEWIYFNYGCNYSDSYGIAQFRRMSNFSYAYNESLTVSNYPFHMKFQFLNLDSGYGNEYVDLTAFESELSYSQDMSVVGLYRQDFEIHNTDYVNNSILQTYEVQHSDYVYFNTNLTQNNTFNVYNITDSNGTQIGNMFSEFVDINQTIYQDNETNIPYAITLNSANLSVDSDTDNITVFTPTVFDNKSTSFVFNLKMDDSYIAFTQTPPEFTIIEEYVIIANETNSTFDIWNDTLLYSYHVYSSLSKYDNITVVFDFHSDDSLLFVYIPEIHVNIELPFEKENSSIWFVCQNVDDNSLFYSGYYNSDLLHYNHSIVDGYHEYYYENITVFPSAWYNFDRFLYASINCSDNSTELLSSSYNITANITLDYSENSYNSTDEPLIINNLTDYYSNYSLVEEFEFYYNVSHAYYDSIYNSTNITIGVFIMFSAYSITANPTLLSILLQFITPVILFGLFPYIFKRKGYWWIMVGFVMGFVVLGYSNIISLIEAIILCIITVIAFVSYAYLLNRRSEDHD